MAYSLNEKELEDEENLNESQGQKLGAESAVITEGPKSSSTSNASGQYTNLQNYLDQNRPDQFGQEFAGRLQESVAGARESQLGADKAFTEAANQGSVEANDELLQEASTTPERVVSDQDKLSAFEKIRDAEYKGPQNFAESEYYQPAYRATNQAKEEAELSKSTSGQQTLLDKYYNRGNYTSGERNLDQLLLGMNPGTRQALQEQQEAAQQQQSQFSELQDRLNAYANQRRSGTAEASEKAKTTVGQSNQAFNEATKKRIQEQIAQNQANIERINNAFRGRTLGGISEGELSSLGVNPRQSLFGFSGDLVYANPNLNTNSLGTQEEFQRAQAYSRLLGQPNTLFTDQVGSQVGAPGYTVNQDLANYIKNQQTGFDKLANRTYFDVNKFNQINTSPYIDSETPITSAQSPSIYNIYDKAIDEKISQQKDPEYQKMMREAVDKKRREIEGLWGANDYFDAYAPLLSRMSPTRIRS